MTTREKMVEYREKHNLTIDQMSEKIGVSAYLLQNLESNENFVTHPKIVDVVRKEYELTELESEDLLPEHRRKHGDKYDPDKFVFTIDPLNINDCLFPKYEEVDYYIHDHQETMARQHKARGYY